MHCSGFPFVYNRRRLIYDSVDIPSVTASPQDLIYVLGSIIESAFFLRGSIGGLELSFEVRFCPKTGECDCFTIGGLTFTATEL